MQIREILRVWTSVWKRSRLTGICQYSYQDLRTIVCSIAKFLFLSSYIAHSIVNFFLSSYFRSLPVMGTVPLV